MNITVQITLHIHLKVVTNVNIQCECTFFALAFLLSFRKLSSA